MSRRLAASGLEGLIPTHEQGRRGTGEAAGRGAAAESAAPKGQGAGGNARRPSFRRKPEPKVNGQMRSEEHTSELQSLMRISYAVFCLKKKPRERTDEKTQLRQINKTQ